ncbi:FadR/GntR family transcriptional regulator [Phreatobacter stygius]|uniref:FadR family transcriptional regulator n=1 Tax=Phreatobacter stygius TaxID=1940610 RepID=A0A4D7BJI9_9HYPH|nr:FCD domain-containing protein [Phreatobacter stygius]QCI67877.1 FadR family transcriptional regulator [Phreatobacter stygius]
MTSETDRFERIQTAPAYQMVAEAIEQQILSGRLQPGDPLGTEADLVRQFKVNRSTVREGIRLLEQGGLIRRDQSRRLHVSLPRYNRLATRVSRALVLHQVTFRELWEASMSLETATVEAAAARATPEDLQELEDNLARMAAARDSQAHAEIDSEFHALIARVSKNRVLQLAREPAGLLFTPTLKMILDTVDAAGPRNLEAHRHIVEACRARDVVVARDWMRRHITDWRRGFEIAGKSLDDPIERTFADHLGLGGAYS